MLCRGLTVTVNCCDARQLGEILLREVERRRRLKFTSHKRTDNRCREYIFSISSIFTRYYGSTGTPAYYYHAFIAFYSTLRAMYARNASKNFVSFVFYNGDVSFDVLRRATIITLGK